MPKPSGNPPRPTHGVSRVLWVALMALALTLTTCRDSRVLYRQLYANHRPPSPLDAPILKAHLRDGSLLVFTQWHVNDSLEQVSGKASRYSPARRVVAQGPLVLPLDSVLLFETNTPLITDHTATLRIMSAVYGVGNLLCASVPKACFGSCPTFYTLDGAEPALQAEGFSSSVAPSLEATDLDALCRPLVLSEDFVLEMRNEALETHAVRWADLLLVPLAPGEFAAKDGSGRFHRVKNLHAPTRLEGGLPGELAALSHADGLEWGDTADAHDLSTRRLLELEFPALPAGQAALRVRGRQSLLTTFLFYQALAWMGSRAGEHLAALERGDLSWDGSFADLGSIRVEVWTGSSWRAAGQLNEVGPLAQDEHLLLLGELPPGPVRLRLDLTCGNWRLDELSLGTATPAEAVRLQPVAVTREDREDPDALARLLDPARCLTTEPGHVYQLHYAIPRNLLAAGAFLETRGWYLEWMREEWLREENPRRLARLLRQPERSLRELAPAYKQLESRMDSIFWSSRYAN